MLILVPCVFSDANTLRGDTLVRYSRLYPDDVIRAAGGEGLLPAIGARLDWDEAGLLAILDDLTSTFDAEPIAFLTAFAEAAWPVTAWSSGTPPPGGGRSRGGQLQRLGERLPL